MRRMKGRRRPEAAAWPAWALLPVLGWLAALLLAPPASARAWGFDAFRALGAPAAVALLAAAALSPWFALRAGRRAVIVSAFVLALLVAFPLRERLHFLGDTQLRIRTIANLADPTQPHATSSGLAAQLHAQPLDALVGVQAPLALVRLGLPAPAAVSCVSLALLALYVAAAFALARRLRPESGGHAALTAAIVLTGSLQAFAGYAESAGLMLVAAMAWWALLLAPLERASSAVRAAAAGLVLFASHRLGIVLLLPQAARALGPAAPGDQRPARRLLLALTALELAIELLWLRFGTPGEGLARDLREFAGAWRAGTPRLTPAFDAFTLVALLAPLSLLAPFLASRDAWRAAWSSPAIRTAALAAAALLPTLLVFPVAPSGLGPQRDWDLAALFALALTVAAAAVLARLPAARLRAALALALPVLVLQAGSWVAANADERAAATRMEAMVGEPSALMPEQASAAHVFLAYRAASQGRMDLAAQNFERAFAALPNRRNELMAAEAWVRAGDAGAARRALARAWSAGPLPAELAPVAAELDTMVSRLERARDARSH